MDPLVVTGVRRSRRREWLSAWLRLAIVAAVALSIPCVTRQASLGAADQPLEYQVKAVFLLNFTKFVEWPPSAFPSPDAPLNLCVIENDSFEETLKSIVGGEVVNGHRIAVQGFRGSSAPRSSCHVVYVANPEIPAMPDTGTGVLTVGEGELFVRRGGMIAFIVEDRHVQFEINQTRAEAAGLRLSSRLLRVAKSVKK